MIRRPDSNTSNLKVGLQYAPFHKPVPVANHGQTSIATGKTADKHGVLGFPGLPFQKLRYAAHLDSTAVKFDGDAGMGALS
jgi:hypothetical protein